MGREIIIIIIIFQQKSEKVVEVFQPSLLNY